jgi:3-phenylpropionate/trans-cinnamate dioxygenase ferredoxin reductase subunit
MLGQREPYLDIPWFWSDQYDLNFQYVGHATKWDEVVLRGDVGGRKFSAFYMEGGKLRAALTVNRHRDIRPARELIKHGVAIESAKLKDEAIELKSLVPVAP